MKPQNTGIPRLHCDHRLRRKSRIETVSHCKNANGARHWLTPSHCYIYMDGSLSHRATPRELAQPIL